MVKVTGIKTNDKALVHDFAMFCLGRFLTPEQINSIRVEIRFLRPDDLDDKDDAQEFREFSAWMTNDGIKFKKPTFTVWMNKSSINTRAKTPIVQFKQALKYLAHELVHVKQYALGDMVDVWDGTVLTGTLFKGVLYPPEVKMAGLLDKWAYWDSPYEVEAYGRMEGLYSMYIEHLNEQACQTIPSATPTA